MPRTAADPNRLRIVDLTATCKNCARIERDAKVALELAAANYLRMSAEVERLNAKIGQIVNRAPVVDPVSTHGKGHSYSGDDRAPSVSELRANRGKE